MDTLVLSSAYQPMTQISWQKAISMWVSGKVEIIEEYKDRTIATVNKVYNMPSIVRFVGGVFKRYKHANKARFSRTNIDLRDRGRCQYCLNQLKMSEFTLDHVVPVSQGGKKEWANIVACCTTCNQKKRNRTPQQANMKLHKKPAVPKILPSRYDFISVPKIWRDYL